MNMMCYLADLNEQELEVYEYVKYEERLEDLAEMYKEKGLEMQLNGISRESSKAMVKQRVIGVFQEYLRVRCEELGLKSGGSDQDRVQR